MNQDDNKFQKVEWSGDQYSPAHDDLDELPAPPARSLSDDDLALLKLAALAIGCVLLEEVEGEEYVNLHFADGSAAWSWNPLTFSGDALELASDLNIHIEGIGAINGDGTIVLGYVEANGLREDYNGNAASRHAATRRAIVRAAAEIGKQQ